MTKDLGLVLVLVATLGVAAQWLAWRFQTPAIIPLIAAGLLVGPGLGWVQPAADFGPLLQPFIGLAVATILFEGGLNLRLHEIRETAAGVRRLVLAGIPVAWCLGSTAAHFVGGLSWPVSLVFGAIIVVTGPTVIMPLLRQARLKPRPATFLKWEGIVNDPLGALLAVLVYEYFVHAHDQAAFPLVIGGVAMALLAGLASGVAVGLAVGRAFRGGAVPEFLKPPFLLAAVLAVYSLTNLVQDEAGLLGVTVFGIVLGNTNLPSIIELRRFKEYITVLLVSALFILLTADLHPADLARLDGRHAALLLMVIFVLRPVTVWLSTLGAGMDWRERALLAWIAPRGIVAAAVAGLFAPGMVALGHADAEHLVPLVFALILLTVLAHGSTLGWLARRLQLAAGARRGALVVGASPWTLQLAETLKALDLPVIIADTSWQRLRGARLAGIPVHFGEVVSHASEETLALHDMGCLLAAASNDAYNALVCTHFAHEFGRTRVYQLPAYPPDAREHKGLTLASRGVFAFPHGTDFEQLQRRAYRGWRFQRTRITESYTYEMHTGKRAADAFDVAVVRQSGELVFCASSQGPIPGPGEVLVSYGPAAVEPRAQGTAQP